MMVGIWSLQEICGVPFSGSGDFWGEWLLGGLMVGVEFFTDKEALTLSIGFGLEIGSIHKI